MNAYKIKGIEACVQMTSEIMSGYALSKEVMSLDRTLLLIPQKVVFTTAKHRPVQ